MTDKTKQKNKLNPFAKPSTMENDDDSKQKQPSSNTPPDASAVMAEFIRSQGLYEGIDMSEFVNAVQTQNTAKAAEIFQLGMANAVKVAMIGAQRIVGSSAQRATETASESARTAVMRQMAMRELQRQLPFASDEALAPLVETTFNGFLTQANDDMQSAIDNTVKYFESSAKQMGRHFGLKEQPRGDARPGSRGFSDSRGSGNNMQNDNDNNNGDGDDGEYDFIAALTSGQQTFETMTSAAAPTGRAQPTPASNAGNNNGNDNAAE